MPRRWTEQYMRERFPAEVREKRLEQGLDPTQKPTHEWLRENGYRQFLRRARELGYTPDTFLLEECGFDERHKEWPCSDGELIRRLEDWLAYHEDVGERLNSTSIGDARTHLRRIMELSEQCIGTGNLLKYGRGEQTVCVRRAKHLMRALKTEFENSQTRSNYITTFRDFLHDSYKDGYVEHEPITALVDRSGWTETTNGPGFAATTDLVKAYFEACETRVEQFLILALAGYGVRPSSICGDEDRDAFVLDAEVPHMTFSDARKNGPGQMPLVIGVDFVRSYFETLEQDPSYDGTILPSDRSADGARSAQWVRDKIAAIGERTDATLPNGNKPTPKHFRQFWYTCFIETYSEWLDRADDVASMRGASSGQVAAEAYAGDSPWFKQFIRYMRPTLEAAFPAEITPADELGNIDVNPDRGPTGQTSLQTFAHTTAASVLGWCSVAIGALTKARLQKEKAEYLPDDCELKIVRPRRLAKGTLVSMVLIVIMGIQMAELGVYFNPITMEAGTPTIPMLEVVGGSMIGALNTLWADYKVRIQDEPDKRGIFDALPFFGPDAE
ncbi:hypothetical protein [Haloarcula quadrata]|nr:hypothetical protein [Haloarcula quadrata]